MAMRRTWYAKEQSRTARINTTARRKIPYICPGEVSLLKVFSQPLVLKSDGHFMSALKCAALYLCRVFLMFFFQLFAAGVLN
jgi:hypothetical protein